MQQRGGEEKADDDAEQDQQPVEHPRVGLGAQFAVLGDVFAEKEVERRHGRSGQQEVFGNTEEVDLRQPDQRPVAEEQYEEDVDAVRELTDASCCGAQVKTVGLAKTFRDMRTDGSHPIG